MPSSSGKEAELDPSFFADRFLIEILSWDCGIHVGVSSDSTPQEYRFQGGLLYSKGIEIEGRVIAPRSHYGETIRIWTLNVGPEIDFTPDGQGDVGRLYDLRDDPRRNEFEASLLLPQDALPIAVTCLASVWKYIHIWMTGDLKDEAPITNFSFSATLHKNLASWVELTEGA